MPAVWGQFGSPKGLPRYPQEHPKGGQESPKTLSIPSSDRKRRFVRIVNIPIIKSKCLRVGGSSWELKIDPKRLQEKISNDFAEDKRRRGEKKDNKNDKKIPREATEGSKRR